VIDVRKHDHVFARGDRPCGELAPRREMPGGPRAASDLHFSRGRAILDARLIGRIRTDLDVFSDAEAAVLENHGYLLADKAIQTYVPHLLPGEAPALSIPHPEWLDPAKVEQALRDSHKRWILGRW